MRSILFTGLVASVAGAALDFASGYSLVQMAGGSMTGDNSLAYAIFLYALGMGVILAGLSLVVPGRSEKVRHSALLMKCWEWSWSW